MDKNQSKSSKTIMSPVFANKEQEKIFAECAEKRMNPNSRLSWDDEEKSDKT